MGDARDPIIGRELRHDDEITDETTCDALRSIDRSSNANEKCQLKVEKANVHRCACYMRWIEFPIELSSNLQFQYLTNTKHNARKA
jgi:hypothetical protein